MGTKNSNTSQELFNLNGKPSFGQALPLAFQHVVAMIIGCVAPAIILAGVSGLSESDTVVLIQASLAMSAISTFIQLFPFIKFKSYQIGAGLPVIMGISFALCADHAVNCTGCRCWNNTWCTDRWAVLLRLL